MAQAQREFYRSCACSHIILLCFLVRYSVFLINKHLILCKIVPNNCRHLERTPY